MTGPIDFERRLAKIKAKGSLRGGVAICVEYDGVRHPQYR